jgi:hypothetical protein
MTRFLFCITLHRFDEKTTEKSFENPKNRRACLAASGDWRYPVIEFMSRGFASIMPICALACGHVTEDRRGHEVLPGGSALYAAKAWRHLGVSSKIATAYKPSSALAHELLGVDVYSKKSAQTTSFINVYPKKGPRRQWVGAVAAGVGPHVLPEEQRRPDVLFVAPVIGEVDLGRWLDEVDAGINGVGLQGFLRGPGPFDSRSGYSPVVPKPWNPDRDLLSRIDAVFLSDEDVEFYGRADLLELLVGAVPIVALTMGERGCRVFHGAQVTDIAAIKIKSKDSTGCGDTFAAGFLAALASRSEVEDAARFATAAASICAEARGPAALDRIAEAFGRMDRAAVHRFV